MNRRGQFGFIGPLILLVFVTIVWIVGLSSWFTQIGLDAQAAGLTGFEAFFYGNLNLWMLCAIILGALGIIYFGGNQ